MKIFRAFNGLIGLVLIAVVGNGFWDVAFRDVYNCSSRSLLTLVTLGMDSARNGIYANVARGHYAFGAFSGRVRTIPYKQRGTSYW